MANGYAPPDEPETPQDVPDEPEAPSNNNGAAPAKISQAQANYRESDKTKCCGLCANFTGSAGEGAFQCTKVAGHISPFGYSDEYTRQDNPFRQGETPDNPFSGTRVTVVAPAGPPMAAVGGMMPPMLGGPNQPGGGTLAAAASPPPQVSNPRTMQTSVMSPRLRIGGKMYGG